MKDLRTSTMDLFRNAIHNEHMFFYIVYHSGDMVNRIID